MTRSEATLVDANLPANVSGKTLYLTGDISRLRGRLEGAARIFVVDKLYRIALTLIVALATACHDAHPAYVVDVVLPGFDATGKLQPGDRIVAIDGAPLDAPVVPALVNAVNARDGAPVTLAFERDGKTQTIIVRPQLDRTKDGRTSWVLGIRPRAEL